MDVYVSCAPSEIYDTGKIHRLARQRPHARPCLLKRPLHRIQALFWDSCPSSSAAAKAAGEAGAALRLCGNISLRLLPITYTCTHDVDVGCAHGWCTCMYIGLSASIVVGRRILGLSVPQPGGGVFSPFGSHCRCASAPPQRRLVPCHSLTCPVPPWASRASLVAAGWGDVRRHRLAATGPTLEEKSKSRPTKHTSHVSVHARHPPSCASAVAPVRYRGTACDTALTPRDVLLDASNGNGAPVGGGHALRGCLPIGPAAVGGTPSDV